MTSHDAVCVGEVLVDLVQDAASGALIPRAGGAPANVAAALASLGRTSAMISAVGNDWLGDEILTALRCHGVDVSHIQCDPDRPTGVAVVSPIDRRGPDFNIYRANAADAAMVLSPDAADAMCAARAVHLGSLLLASPAGEPVLEQAQKLAGGGTTFVSYDVNLRPSAWVTAKEMRDATRRMITVAQLVKVTEHELRLLDLDVTPRTTNDTVWLVTDSAAGARIVAPGLEVRRDVPRVAAIDPTGAGDASLATLLDSVLTADVDVSEITAEFADHTLDRSIRVATHTVQQIGAMCDLSSFAVT